MHKQQSKNPKGKNTYMYMNELKELERKTNSSMEFIIYLFMKSKILVPRAKFF